MLASIVGEVVAHAEEANLARRQEMLLEHALEVVADLPRGRPLVEAGVRADLVDRVGAEAARVHAVERRRLVQAHERVGVVPVAARTVAPVDHHHVGVGVGDQRIGERHPGRARSSPALINTKGFAAPEVEHAYARARALCESVSEAPQRFSVLRGLWQFHNGRGAYQTARELGQQCLQLAQQGHDSSRRLEGHHTLWTTNLLMGELPLARTHLEQGLALYDPQQHRALAVVYGHDPGVCCRGGAAIVFWLLGYPDQALRQLHAAHTLAQEGAHSSSVAFARMLMAIAYQLRREIDAAHEQAEALVALATEQGFELFLAIGGILRGGTRTAPGQRGEQISQIRQNLAAQRETGSGVWEPYFLGLLADVYAQDGQVEAGLVTLDEALAAAQATGQRLVEAELYRLRGSLLLRQTGTSLTEVETWLQRALDVARRQEAKSLELRAADESRAGSGAQQGKRKEAHDLLAEVYAWFTEGFDTADLQEARALLEELA